MSAKSFHPRVLIGLQFLFALLLLVGTTVVFAQEEGEQDADAKYRAEYNLYLKSVDDGPDALLAFIKEHPESKLVEYAVGSYMKAFRTLADQGQHKEAVDVGVKFLEQVDGEQFQFLFLTTWSSFYSQQYDKAVQYGEKAVSLQPETPQLLPILTRSYLNLGNIEKFLPLGEKYSATVEPKECYDIIPTIMRHYAEAKDYEKASQYAQKTIQAFDTVAKPEGVAQADWDSFANEEKSVAYSVIGRRAFESKNWQSTTKNYAQSRKLNPGNKVRSAEGYYYTGMSLWNMEQIDAAMAAFAKGSLLKSTPHQEPCQQQLEKLYKGTHNGSLAGLEEFLDSVGSN